LLYRTLALPEELREGAVVLGLVMKLAMQQPRALARAGFGGSPIQAATALFQAILDGASGVVFAVDEWQETMSRVATPDRKLHLALPDLLEELGRLVDEPPPPLDAELPFVLSAGERRSFTANTIIRDPAWRKKDAAGALRIHPDDAAALGVQSGEAVRLTTRRGSAVVPVELSASMQRGHLSLPNGLGVGYAGAATGGVAPNELTSVEDRDPFVGTPWHKYVPARVERL
jgi:anaerobic selenocysteine-containing dehydrogenase